MLICCGYLFLLQMPKLTKKHIMNLDYDPEDSKILKKDLAYL